MDAADLPLLRSLSLKGIANEAILSGTLRSPELSARLVAAVNAGDARELPRGYALTPQGRETLKRAQAAEREAIDPAAMAAAYGLFCALNRDFKALMHRWQIRQGDGQDVPNDHRDAAYDAAVIADLGEIDRRMQPLLGEIVALAPRLALVPARFAGALAAVRGGDAAMMARPLVDSYHTIWFELHEELIDLSGRSRAEEAAAGRGD